MNQMNQIDKALGFCQHKIVIVVTFLNLLVHSETFYKIVEPFSWIITLKKKSLDPDPRLNLVNYFQFNSIHCK
jgi:hypothetical protein